MSYKDKGNISRKLMFGFGWLILLFVVYELYSLYEVHTISKFTRTIYNHPLVVSNASLQANVSVTKMHRNMKDVVLFESASRVKESIAAVDEQEQVVYQNLDIVQERILGEEGEKLAQETRLLFDNWRPIREEVINLVESGSRAEAAEITIGKGANHVDALEEKMLALTSYARNKASLFMGDSQRTSTRLITLSILLFGIAIFIFLLIGFFTLRGVRTAEEKIWESGQLLTNAIDYASIGMVLVEPKGMFQRVNEAFCEMTGYSEKELLRKSFNDLTYEEDYDIGLQVIKELIDNEIHKAVIEKRYVRKDGKIIDVYLTTTLLRDEFDQPLYFFTQAIDITERKQKEQESLILKAAVDQAPVGVALADKDINIYYCNPEGLGMRGGNSDELVKIPKDALNNWQVLRPDGEPYEISDLPLVRAMHNGQTIREEFIVRHQDGFGHLCDAIACPVYAGDEIIGGLVLFLDITERKKVEERLRQSHKMEAIGTLAGGIAHDFNNILASIIGFTELALDEAGENSELNEHLHEVQNAGLRARELVKQILAFARKSEEKMVPIQPGKVAREITHLLRSTIPTTIEIDACLESDAYIMGNATQLHQIIMNLCTNAAHAMEEGFGKLSITIKDVDGEQLPVNVRPKLQRRKYVQLQVSDTGVGIHPDTINSIFEPYFTTKPIGEGSGMGLAVVQGIVESYDGHVEVASRLGEGTTFTLYLPVSNESQLLPDQVQQDLEKGSERILIVDDEPSVARMGSSTLQRLGYEVTACTSSLEALDLFKERSAEFDLVISDMTMPDMTGDMLAAEILKIRPDIPVILCTGFSKRISEDVALDKGIKAVLNKPFERVELTSTIRRVLDQRQASYSG